MRLRRAVALNLASSSSANLFSKPSSRLSKLVIGASRVMPGLRQWPCISAENGQINVAACRAAVRGGSLRGRRHCAPHPDRLRSRRGRTARFPRVVPPPPPRTAYSKEPRHHMDFLKPRYTPMSRRRRIYEGKAKVLYEGPEPGTLIQHFKDDATAFNAKKHQVIEGKGVLNNRISEYVFQHLNNIGVPTHFIRRLNMREQLIREVE